MDHAFGEVVLVPLFADFTTIEQGLVVRTMGKLSAVDLHALRDRLGQVIG